MAELLTFEAAQQLVLARAHVLPSERVAIGHAIGRVTGEAVCARTDLPPFPSSAMDGFAVRASDLPGILHVVASSAAGAPASQSLGAGEAIAISTGGVVPAGADAVIPIESVVQHDNTIESDVTLEAGSNVRPRGGDAQSGAVVIDAGVRIGAVQLGAIAAAGVVDVVCTRRPRVAVLATGSELVQPGDELRAGEIYESNGLMLAAALGAAGAEVDVLPPVADDESAHRDALARGLEADVLVSSGGVSVGPHDLVRSIERELGVEEVFWRVAMRPGKPISFGVRGETLVFGLPGNPVSSLVGCELFVKPAVRALQGERDPLPRFEQGVLGSALRRNPERDDFVRARILGGTLEPLSGQESHMIVRSAAADALVHVSRGNGEVAAGASVPFVRL